MELKIEPTSKNKYPIGGILIQGSSVKDWLFEIQKMGLNLQSIKAYAIPNTIANSIWGCLLVCDIYKKQIDIGKNYYCQLVNTLFFIPENTILFPTISLQELEKLCKQNLHIMHPDFGLVELLQEIDWVTALKMPNLEEKEIAQPADSVFISHQIKSFQIKPIDPDNVLDNLEKKSFPKQEKFKDTSLNFLENIKLTLYKLLYVKDTVSKLVTEKPLLGFFRKMISIFDKHNKWTDNFQEDFENLEHRNQKQLDRFLELMRKNPEEALKYAIPLDNNGTTRGGNNGAFDLSKRWFDFSLSSNQIRSSGNGNVLMADDTFTQLNKQYNQTAEELIKQKNYEKAAFVYLKLLKNNLMAAQTLENGKLYQEAAAVYIKYVNNKLKAAECYEKGSMTEEAIDLYKEMNNDEKVGDLYMSINMKKDAFMHYEKIVEKYKNSFQFVKASLIYKKKMSNQTAGQEMLLSGWRANKDAFNCLNNYFENITDIKQLGKEIQVVYSKDVMNTNCESFLKVIKYEYEKKNEIQGLIKLIAYEIIANQASKNASIINELCNFNRNDKQLIKDVMRYKVSKK